MNPSGKATAKLTRAASSLSDASVTKTLRLTAIISRYFNAKSRTSFSSPVSLCRSVC